MQIVENTITIEELKLIATKMFGNLIKAVVDIEKEILVIDADLHSDQEAFLIEQGSKQTDLWGINLYPDKTGDNFIEFDSMINLRPAQHNNTRGIESIDIQKRIINIINKKITK